MTRSVRFAHACLACAALALGGCATERYSPGLETTVLAAVIDYQCEGGIRMRVERAPDARSARVTMGSRSWTLTRVDSAAQEKYGEGLTALYLDGDVAIFENDSRIVGGKCQSSTPMPKAPTMRKYDFF
ncbi:MAG: MliC family protein [Burkholderiales bacterium]|nr:MliC family protein [Burkholderiales bacterium]